MELRFLGTSAGVPTLQRNVTGIILGWQNRRQWCLVDCGEGTQHQLLKTRFSLTQLAAVFITHVHGDHCYGLPGLLASASMCGRKEPLTIIAPAGIREFVETAFRLTDAYVNFELQFIASETLTSETVDHWQVAATPLSHRVPCYAYDFTESAPPRHLDTARLETAGVPRGPLWGRLQKEGQITLDNGQTVTRDEYLLPSPKARKVVIAGDNDSPELLSDTCDNADVLVHEATYTEAVSQKLGPAPQHSSALQVARFAESVQLPNLVLTHFSARYHAGNHYAMKRDASIGAQTLQSLHQEAVENYSGRLFLADDLAGFTLDKQGQLHGEDNGE